MLRHSPSAASARMSRSRRAATGLRMRGWVAFQWDHAAETTEGDLRNDLLSVPFRLEARELGRGFALRSRGAWRRRLSWPWAMMIRSSVICAPF